MLALSSIIACLSLLGLAVLALHSYQLRAASVSAERSVPLMAHGIDLDIQSLEISDPHSPIPTVNDQLEDISLQNFKPVDPELLFTASASNAPIDSNFESEGIAAIDAGLSQASAEAALPPTPPAPLTPPASDSQPPQYPLLGAYTQRCIELRQRLKTISANPKLLETTLQALYRTAAVAELLHSKKSVGKLSLGQLKMLPDELITGLEMPYSKLGYSELRLLRKSDIKRMLLLWGKPEVQQCPRSFHRQNWQAICQRYG